MKAASFWVRSAPVVTSILCVFCVIGLWALMTLPQRAALYQFLSPVQQQFASADKDAIYSYRNDAPYKGNYTTVSRFSFSDKDIALYKQLYALQAKGKWEQANKLGRQISDAVLISDVLAQRFLHESYDSNYEELYQWLRRFSDHPDADRLRRLAKRMQPRAKNLPAYSNVSTLSGRYGVRDGIGGRGMPRGWQSGLSAWEDGKYITAEKQFSALAAKDGLSKWQSSAVHYWAYRANMKLKNRNKAAFHLREAARHPFTFYGALAATHYTTDQYKPLYSKVDTDISTHPAVKRAAAFIALGNPNKASRELRHLYPTLAAPQRRQVVTLAAAYDLPGLQLRLSQMQHDDPEQSDITAYPTPEWVPHYDMMTDPALVYAIIRQESAFNPNARSHAGARGAMQIMPQTANYMIKYYKLNEVKMASLDMQNYPQPIQISHLNQPDVNLMIGQHYIKYLSEKSYIDGNIIYLLSAYNAGPGNLIKWQQRYEHIQDPLLFMERIPFKETRHYVKQVMANYLVYQAMLYGQAQSVQALTTGAWPTLPPRDVYTRRRVQEFAQAQ